MAPSSEVTMAAQRLRRAALSALACTRGGADGFERSAAEADERLVDLMAVITGEKREHQRRRTFTEPEQARGTLRCMLGLATELTAHDLDMEDVRGTFRGRCVPVEPRHLGERLAAAGFDLNTAARFPSSDSLHQAFTVADQATRNCGSLLKAGLKAAKYAFAPSAFGVINDVTAMLGRAEYQRHLRDLARAVARLGLTTRTPTPDVDPPEIAQEPAPRPLVPDDTPPPSLPISASARQEPPPSDTDPAPVIGFVVIPPDWQPWHDRVVSPEVPDVAEEAAFEISGFCL
ncbi:hypothetical protein ACFXKY_05905 [Streptomyces canus]|uniref:hypothetical protein n=1 Tax=Streptomyces canus TaxID=58343 RepID=UPI0036CA779E